VTKQGSKNQLERIAPNNHNPNRKITSTPVKSKTE
jgi:hypothetical protein